MAQGYFNANYFHPNYWQANYWSEGGGDTGDYWANRYWQANYWHPNYWQAGAGEGDVNQTSAPSLGFTPQVTQANAALNVEATTPALGFTPQSHTAGLSLEVDAGFDSLSLTPLDAEVNTATNIYQLGDIDLRFVPDSDITVTYGILATAPSLVFTDMAHTVGETGGINVAASLPSLNFTPLVTDSRLDIAVEPLPPSLGFTAQNTTAGIGTQVASTQPTLGFSVATHTIVGTPEPFGDVNVSTASLGFTVYDATVSAKFLPADIQSMRMTVEDSIGAVMTVEDAAIAKMKII